MAIDKCLVDVGQVEGKAYEEEMNELERLKQAMEAEPMAVIVMDMPRTCEKCGERYKAYFKHEGWVRMCGRVFNKRLENDWEDKRANWCPLHEAIGIIEPNGHVVYLREEDL